MNQPNLPTTIRHKYIAHLRAITAFNDDQRITLDAVDFALACALADLNECWADEHASLQQRTTRLQNELISARELEQRLQAGLNQTMLENDVLEAECNRLKQMIMISASSAPTTATTAPSAPAASTTSKPPAPTPPSPTASTTASAATAAPASSATTSPRKPGRPSTSKPPKTPKNPLPSAEAETEAGQTTSLDPIQSPDLRNAATLLANTENISRQIAILQKGTDTWRRYDPPLRLAILAHLWQEQWSKAAEFDRTRPQWMPTAGAVAFLSPNARWSQIEGMIRTLRAPPSATTS